jgi:hypothetical protein
VNSEECNTSSTSGSAEEATFLLKAGNYMPAASSKVAPGSGVIGDGDWVGERGERVRRGTGCQLKRRLMVVHDRCWCRRLTK